MPTEQPLAIASLCARRHFHAPVDICLKLRACFARSAFQIRLNILLQCFSRAAAVRYNTSVKNLHKVLARIITFKISCGIYKHIQRNAIYKGCVMELFVVSRNHQCVKIAVQIVRSIRIRAIKDHGKRRVCFLNISENLFQYHHLVSF